MFKVCMYMYIYEGEKKIDVFMFNVAVQLKTSVSFFDQSLCVSVVPSTIHFLLCLHLHQIRVMKICERIAIIIQSKKAKKKKMWCSPDEMCSLLSRRPLAAAITSAAGLHWVSLKINERRCFSRHSGLDNLHPDVCLHSLLISWREVISHAALPLCLRGHTAASWHSASLSGSGGHRRH